MENIEYREGNIRELWRTSFPLMLSWLSFMMMNFVDRLFLARYSLEAMSAAVMACTLVWAFNYGLQLLCEMAQVFVAQYNGAKQYTNLAQPVWQMLWVSLGSVVFFVPLAYWGAGYFFPGAEGALQREYFTMLTYFGPAAGLLGASSAFFVGQGRTAIITYTALIGNAINIILDPILIFGIEGYIPSYGVAGAAFATGLAGTIQGFILLFLMLRTKNPEAFGIDQWKLNLKLMKQCLSVGLPTAFCVFLEIVGWATFYYMMNASSPTHIIVAGTYQSILMLFMFYGFGIEKGVAAVGGNLIGAGLQDRLPRLLKSAFTLTLIFMVFVTIPLVIYPDFLISWFLSNPTNLEVGAQVNFASVELDLGNLHAVTRTSLLIGYFYLFVESVRWATNGLLLAAGDTVYLMVSGTLAIWFFLLLPIYYFIVLGGGSVEFAMILMVFYSIATVGLIYGRFLWGNWQGTKLIEHTQQV